MAIIEPVTADAKTRKIVKARRNRRVGFIWLFALVFVAGNLWDWFGGHSWGPEQATNQAIWVHISAGLFWLALAMFFLCLRDLGSFLLHGKPPPIGVDTAHDASWWDRMVGNPVRRRIEAHTALIGVAGLFAGALFGYFFWKP